MTLEERLNEVIEERECEIENLSKKIDELKGDLDSRHKAWMHHSVQNPFEFTKKLPLPRLEMRQRKEGYYTIFSYGIVYKHFSEMKEELTFIPLGETKCSGAYTRELPFRDGVHMRHDSKIFNLPGFLIDIDNLMVFGIEDCK